MAVMQSIPAARWRWFLRTHWTRLVIILAAVLIEMGFTSAVPFSFKYLVDQALIKHNGAALAKVLSLLGAGAILMTGMGLWRDRLYAVVQADYIARIRQEMFVHLQRLGLDFYTRTKRLEIMLHFKRYLGWVEAYATMLVSHAILPLLKVVTSGILMYVVDWRLGLASTVLLPLTYIGPRRYGPRVMAEYTNRKIQEGAAEDIVKQNVDSQPVVKAFSLQRKYLNDFDEKNQALTTINVLHAYYGALVRRTVGAGSLLGQVAVMGLGSYLVWNAKLSIGSLAAFQALFVGLNSSLSDFMQNLPAMMQARDGMMKIERLLSEHPVVADVPDAKPCGPLSEAIVFEDVTFGYSAEQTQLAGVTFTIPRGRSVAVVGTNGSGKSTILNMLERFYDARSGGIFIDGKDIRTLSQDSIRSRIGMVFQDPALLEMSVADNIRCGKLDATDREIMAAARKAEVHSVIVALPDGYATVIKEKTKLTQAQRQRIALARAIVRHPDVLVLDEATSTLEPQAEAAFSETVARLRRDFTVLEVSGRLATTAAMDTIVVMDRGAIVEQGSHAELLARGGAYHDLWNKQSGFTFSADGDEAQITVERLSDFPIFSALSASQLEDIVGYMSSESVAADRIVVQEGDPGEYFYIIVRGIVDVLKHGDEGDVRVATLEGGDYFGEVSLLRNEPRTATVRTQVPTIFLQLHRSHFARLLESAPGLRESLEANYERRLGVEMEVRRHAGESSITVAPEHGETVITAMAGDSP